MRRLAVIICSLLLTIATHAQDATALMAYVLSSDATFTYPAGCVSLWRFNHADGRDYSGFGNNGTVLGDYVGFPVGGYGNRYYLTLTGPTSRSRLQTASTSLHGSGEVSIGGWFRLNPLNPPFGGAVLERNANGIVGIMTAYRAGPEQDTLGYITTYGTENTIDMYGWFDSHAMGLIYYTPYDTWTHITMTWKSNDTDVGGDGIFRLYINGNLYIDSMNGAYITWGGRLDCDTPFVLGVDPYSTNRSFYGDMEEVFMFNRQLSAAEVLNIYTATQF